MRHVIRLKLSYAQHELKKLEHKGMLKACLINAVVAAKIGSGPIELEHLYTGSRL